MPEQIKCPLCEGQNCYRESSSYSHRISTFACGICGWFAALDLDVETYLTSTNGQYHRWRYQVAALLNERKRKRNGAPERIMLCMNSECLSKAALPGYRNLHVESLLADWPNTLEAHIERCLLGFVGSPSGAPRQYKQKIYLNLWDSDSVWRFLTNDRDERDYYIDLMGRERGWVAFEAKDNGGSYLSITSTGWQKIESLLRGTANRNHEAFVAMWFGVRHSADGKDVSQGARMQSLYEEALKPAVIDAGFKVKRSDPDEHNGLVINKILADIQRAPFLVADLTENNPNVYYEAGFAKGLGREVFYCSPKDQPVRFDVDAISRIEYSNLDELRDRLTSKIVAEMGPGPFERNE